MKAQNVIEKIIEIKKREGDYEVQHVIEDGLHVDFIRFVEGIDLTKPKQLAGMQALAKMILEIQDMDFPRHCA